MPSLRFPLLLLLLLRMAVVGGTTVRVQTPSAKDLSFLGGGTLYRSRPFTYASKRGTKTIASFSGLGCVSVRIDGVSITEDTHMLSPGFSTIPSERLLYDTMDVTSYFRSPPVSAPSGHGGEDDDRLTTEHVVEISTGQCKYGYMDNTDEGLYCVGAHGSTATCRAIYFSLEEVNQTAVPSASHLEDPSSSSTIVVLDTSNPSDWMTTTENNPIVYTHLYHGEIYDANREVFDTSLWKEATPYDFDANGQVGAPRFFTPSADMPPIGVAEEIDPVDAFRVTGSDGEPAWVFDFGNNFAGVTRLNNIRDLPPNATITLRHAELLQSATDRTVQNTYCAWPCPTTCGQADGGNCANQTDQYRSSATGTSTPSYWQPTHTYHGFRFVQVEGWPTTSSVSAPNVTALVVHSLLADAANVHFDNASLDILNRIQTAIRTTQLANLVSIPTDCPQREKRGWLGDAQWTSGEAATNFDMRELYRNFLRTMRDTQVVGCRAPGENPSNTTSPPLDYVCCDPLKPTFGCSWLGVKDNFTDRRGALSDVVPYGKKTYGAFPGDPSWTVAPAIIAWETWRRTGDTSVVRDAYETAKDLVDFLTRHGDSDYDGLVRFGYYGDWLALASTPVPQVSSFSHILAVSRVRDMARVLGKSADATTYATLRDRLAKKWDDTYWNETSQSYGSSQSANALALYILGAPSSSPSSSSAAASYVADANRTRAALDALVQRLQDNAYGLTTGALGARYIFHALGANGRVDVALKVLTKTDQPSFGYMIEQGPGTIWENWDGDRYRASGSKSHPMFSGGVGLYLYDLAGYVTTPSSLSHATDVGAARDTLQHHLRVTSTIANLVGAARVRNRGLRASWKMTGKSSGNDAPSTSSRFEFNVSLASSSSSTSVQGQEHGAGMRESVRMTLPFVVGNTLATTIGAMSRCHRVEERLRGSVGFFGSCTADVAKRSTWHWETAKSVDENALVTFVLAEAGDYQFLVRPAAPSYA